MEGKDWDTLDTDFFQYHTRNAVEEGLGHSKSLKIAFQAISHSAKDNII